MRLSVAPDSHRVRAQEVTVGGIGVGFFLWGNVAFIWFGVNVNNVFYFLKTLDLVLVLRWILIFLVLSCWTLICSFISWTLIFSVVGWTLLRWLFIGLFVCCDRFSWRAVDLRLSEILILIFMQKFTSGSKLAILSPINTFLKLCKSFELIGTMCKAAVVTLRAKPC